MKIVDAIWEKRNLGVTCYEIHLEKNDRLLDVKEKYGSIKEHQYMVARVPSTRYDLADFFQKQGYVFMESAFALEHDLKEITIPERLRRICDKCGWEKMDRDDMERLSRECYHNIFTANRFFPDPEFTERQAAQRYDFWIKDMIKEGHIPYKVIYGKEIIGFFLYKHLGRNIYYSMLAGIYKDFEGSGMGCCVQYAGIRSAMDEGAHKYIGRVSGNNPSVLRFALSIGYQVKDIEYIFIKHNKGE